MLLIAILAGMIFHSFFSLFIDYSPFLLIGMLFLSYCKITFADIRLEWLHIYLLAIQIIGSLLTYVLLAWWNPMVAQGIMICLLAPTATAAAVITGMLGGNVGSITVYTFLSNVSIALFAPFYFSLIGMHTGTAFMTSFWVIMQKVVPILLTPAIAAFVAERYLPRFHNEMKKRQNISFYLWSLAITIVIGKTFSYIFAQPAGNYHIMILLVFSALVVCLLQFFIGRIVGTACHETVTGGQGLGQKNTALAIWMAHAYLNPVTSVGLGAYAVWQNLINAYQLWRKQQSEKVFLKPVA